MRTTYPAALIAALLALSAPVTHATKSLSSMPTGPVRDATEALASAHVQQALHQAYQETGAEIGHSTTSKHDDHSAETLWLLNYIPLGMDPQGFFSFENAASYAQTATMLVSGDSGRLLRSVAIRVPGDRLAHINSQDILNGNPGKGVTSTVVARPRANEAAWAFATAPANMWIRAYLRTPEGFVTGMSRTLERYISTGGYAVEQATFFNPGSNQSIVSVLRVLNAFSDPRTVAIVGTDEFDNLFGPVRCRLGGSQAITLTARALEEGPSGCTGRLGDGVGKWRLFVSEDSSGGLWFSSMSQLWSVNVGIVTNVSFPDPYHFTR